MKTYIKVIIAFIIGVMCAIAYSAHAIIFLGESGTKVIVPEVSQVAVYQPANVSAKIEVMSAGKPQTPPLTIEERIKMLELRVSILEAKLK